MEHPGCVTIHPGSEFYHEVTMREPLTHEQIGHICDKSDKFRLFVLMKATYYDAFRKKLRTTIACAAVGNPRVFRSSYGLEKDDGTCDFEYAQHHNEAD